MGTGSSGMKGPARQFSGPTDADNFFGGEEGWDKLTTSEKDAMKKYTGSYYATQNEQLRNPPPSNSVMKDTIEMDKAIAKQELKDDILVYRGSGPELLGLKNADIDEFNKAGLKGSIVTDKGFTSTSVLKGEEFGGKVKYNIRIPKGKGRGMYVERNTKNHGEYEYVAKRGGRYRVLEARQTGARLEVDLEML